MICCESDSFSATWYQLSDVTRIEEKNWKPGWNLSHILLPLHKDPELHHICQRLIVFLLSLYWVVRLWWSHLRTRKFPKLTLGSLHRSCCPVYIYLQFYNGRNGNVSTFISSWILTALFEGSSWSSWFHRFLICLISSLGHVFARFNLPVRFLRLIGDDLFALWVIDIESRGDKYIRGIKVPGWLLGKGWIADELLI